VAKEKVFASRYKNPIDLTGRGYQQVIKQLFKENRLAKGPFIGLGRRLNLKVPFIFSSASTKERDFDAEKSLGFAPDRTMKRLVPAGISAYS
jgi:poly(3-hydroxybutyrate) depolymerase